jgi:UDP-N-acetylmuramoyl-L-alanyl-D-glutamate--2,6-diaminopimelate ligase
MKLSELLHPWVMTTISDCDVVGLQNDSRKVKPGYLFLAYPGAAADGRLFIQQAIISGAVAIVYDPEKLPSTRVLPSHIPCFPVPQLGMKLAAIASRFYDYPTRALSITGVTGTNGKTTIAYQLAQAYSLLGGHAAYIGTLGQGQVQALEPLLNTTPDALSLQQFLHEYQQAGIQHVCMEVSSHALSQGRVDQIDFTQGIYTNLSHEHLDYHHTMQAYADAKALLFEKPSLQWAIINDDDEYSSLMMRNMGAACKKLTYGLNDGCDVRAVNWQISMSGSQLEVVSPWGKHDVRVNLLGKFNIYNSLAVFASLLANGVAVTDAVQVMGKLKASPGRMEVVAQKPCVIVDYAHTPDALDNVLSTLGQLKKGRLGVVFGCGGDRDKTKRPMMGRIASQYADFVIVTSDNPRSEDPLRIVEDVAEGLLPTIKAIKIVDREQAIDQGLQMAGDLDILLIAGKGHEAYQQIGKERFVFSDQDVVRKLLSKR